MTTVPGSAAADGQTIRDAVALIRQWRIGEAHVLLAAIIAERGPQLRPLHRTTIVRLLADTSRELGDLKLAILLAGPLLQECQRRYGTSHPATVRAAVSVAALQYQLGEDEQADRALQRVLSEPTVRMIGPLAREAIIAVAYRTLIAIRRGAAEPSQLQQHVNECRIVLGPRDPHTIRLTIELAQLHLTTGRLTDALHLLGDVHAEVLTQHGHDHPLALHLAQATRAWSPPSASQPPPPAPAVEKRRCGPRRAIAVIGVLSAITVLGTITAVALPPQPATWTHSPTPAQAAAVHVTVDDRTATISLSPPASPAAVTVVVTVGGTIRRTITLPTAADRQLVIGIGSGRVCAVATWNQGTRMIATASDCAGEPT
ncbi:tetratricopeptide repeat protein [Hamadaea sp. NPDC050747]|uniref:tetratricopeptide repeat protein n=1 Tax=Hamadaea sp. NPDC050747 TaxID=3155789 RepID=UPI0033FE6B32